MTAKKESKRSLITERDSENGQVYDFRCPYPSGCGQNGVPFSSTGWADRDHAVDRGKQHIGEHEGTPAQSLDEFRAERGLTAASAGDAINPDDWEF